MITIEKLFENVSYTSSADISKIKIKGIATDSRQVKDGDLFVCIKGKDDDGHKHALEAQMLGAVAILAEHATESGLPTAIVTNSRQSYSKICQNFFEKPHLKLKIVSIVGTNGKTTTSYIAEHLLKSAGYKTGVIGTIGYKILDETYEADLTTPDNFDARPYHFPEKAVQGETVGRRNCCDGSVGARNRTGQTVRDNKRY